MAASKKPASSESADDAEGKSTPGSVVRLVISNFRSIGAAPVTIDLDKIVVLVGPNNVGKSSILRAYKSVIEDAELSEDDFRLFADRRAARRDVQAARLST